MMMRTRMTWICGIDLFLLHTRKKWWMLLLLEARKNQNPWRMKKKKSDYWWRKRKCRMSMLNTMKRHIFAHMSPMMAYCASKVNQKMIEITIRIKIFFSYCRRGSGDSRLQRYRHGWIILMLRQHTAHTWYLPLGFFLVFRIFFFLYSDIGWA